MAATTPEVSCPKMRGEECDPVEIFLRSVPQTPHEWTRTSISAGPIWGTGTVSRRMSFTPRYTAASIVAGIERELVSSANCPAIAIVSILNDAGVGSFRVKGIGELLVTASSQRAVAYATCWQRLL